MEMPEEPLGKPHIVVHPVQKARQLRVPMTRGMIVLGAVCVMT